MSEAFTYRILRYVHDPAAGETLNIGVILYAPASEYLGARLDTHYERLSKTFSDFNGDNFRRVLRRFENAVDRYRENRQNVLPMMSETPDSVDQIARQIWPHEELSFRLGPTLAGITESPEEELDEIFERMVLSQYPREDKHSRTDDEIWTVYKRPLAEKAVVSVLRPKTIATSDFKLDFEYAFCNENWHALQPLSLDFARSESIQRKAAQWLGNCTALQGNHELKKLYLLLGSPQLQSYKPAYEKAKNILRRIPVKHEIIEEREASQFADELRSYMKKHTVIPKG